MINNFLPRQLTPADTFQPCWSQDLRSLGIGLISTFIGDLEYANWRQQKLE